MQQQHVCITRIVFNDPKGDTQPTYFWWAKFFTCRVARALFGPSRKRPQRNKGASNKTGCSKMCPNWWGGSAASMHYLPSTNCKYLHWVSRASRTLDDGWILWEYLSYWQPMANCVQQPKTERKKGLQWHCLDPLNQLQTSCPLGCAIER